MNSLENLRVVGRLNIVVKDADGNIKQTKEVDNLVVASGITFIASRMGSAASAVMSHMAIGTGTTAATAANTALEAEQARVTLTSATSGASNIVYVASFPAGTPAGSQAITEAGIFNDPTTGGMLCRTVFPVVNKGALDSMTITWTITLTAV